MNAKQCIKIGFVIASLLVFVTLEVNTQTSQSVVPTERQLTADQKASLGEALQLRSQVLTLQRERKFDQAISLAKRVVELREKVLGKGDVLVADAISILAGIYVAKGVYERAETHFRTALRIYENSEAGEPNAAYVLDMLASLRWAGGDFAKAEAFAKRAIDLKINLYGELTPQVVESVNNLIRTYDTAGQIVKRNAQFLYVIAMFEKEKSIVDRLVLFNYECSLRKDKQTPEVDEIRRRIHVLLAWDPATAPAPSWQGILNGRAISLPRPAYPAKGPGVTGRVVVEVEIDECGNVVNARAVSGERPLRSLCESAARAARFSPTLVFGSPLRVRGVIQYNFKG